MLGLYDFFFCYFFIIFEMMNTKYNDHIKDDDDDFNSDCIEDNQVVGNDNEEFLFK